VRSFGVAERGVRTQVVTILFCDLVASTERRARMGDDAFDEFNARLLAAIRDTLAEHDGHEASNAGDGIMAVFARSAADAVSCATELHTVVAELDPIPPKLRIGISSGEVAVDGGEYHGMPIVEAARLESKAEAGQTLASAVVKTLVGSRRSLRFREVGALDLKGIPEPLPTVEVVDGPVVADVEVTDGASARRTGKRAKGAGSNRRVALIAAVVVAIGLVAGLVTWIASSGDGGHVASSDQAAAAGITAPKGYTPKYTTVACPDRVTSVASDATCGQLVVPESRDHPKGRQVTLLVTRAPARNPGPAVAPSIDLCGCEDLGNSIARDHAELIEVSNRGFGDSQPVLDCPAMNAARRDGLTRPADDPGSIATETAALRACHAELAGQGFDLSAYNFDAVALDTIDMMYALHIPTADFTASDLVSAPVFGVLRRAPGAVRSITFENPAPPGKTFLTDPIADLQASFDHFIELCQKDPTCIGSYPDLAAKWKAAVENARQHPTLVMADDPDDQSKPKIPVLVDGFRLVDALHASLESADAYGLIPAAITSPTTSAAVATQTLIDDYYAWSPDVHWGTLASYICSYDVHTMDTGAMDVEKGATPQFVQSTPQRWPGWCGAWKVNDLNSKLDADVVSPVPTLIFRGHVNPQGRDEWVSTLQHGLSKSQAVIFPTLGGGLLVNGPPCLSALRRDFLANPSRTLDTTGCANLSPPVQWVPTS
jgi:class 3 adenylate cyclase